MIENTPRCRLCGYQLKDTANSCVTCADIKKNLIWPVIEEEASTTSAASVVAGTIRLLHKRVKKLQHVIKSEGTHDYEPSFTKDIVSMARALKELAAEKRKLEQRETEEYGALGIEGRMTLFIEQFFTRLPSDFQVKFIEAMQLAFKEQSEQKFLTQ